MRRKIFRRTCAVLCLTTLAAAGICGVPHARAGAPDVWAITGATIVSVTGERIEKGTVVIRNGLIVDVGSAVAAPADARILDGTGLTVYPGFIDAFSFVDEQQQEERRAPQPPRLPKREEPSGVTPGRTVFDVLKPGKFEAMRNQGITALLAVPRGGIVRGHSAVVTSAGDSVESMSVKAPAALHLAFETQGGFGDYPGSLMGIFAVIRQEFSDAQHHKQAWATYAASKRGLNRPVPSKELDSFLPALERVVPVVVEANADKEIRRAVRFASEFNLRVIVAGGGEAAKSASLLKSMDVPVLLSLNFPVKPVDLDAESYESLRTLRSRDEAPGVAAKLHQAGVRFAFQSGGLRNPKDYLANAAKAVEAGLPRDEALKAMTIYPARILGVDEQLGSIEAGKIANLVVTKGDLFDKDSRIRFVFVDGKRFELKEEAPRPAGAPGVPAADVAGQWTFTVNTPEGAQQMTADLTQSGADVRGSVNHPILGAMEVKNGAVGGDQLTFTITVNLGGNSVDANFSLKVSGNTLDGTVSLAGQGSFQVSGTKPKGK